jgi:DNA-binding MarR family transcriptional regulator
MKKPPRKRAAPGRANAAYRSNLEAAKHGSTLQLLFKAARLLDEQAVRRVSSREGAPQLRRSHTALLPHIDLDGTRIGDLAERLGVSKQAVSELVDDLEAHGVVARGPDPDDARARRVSFTPAGLDGLMRGLAELRAFEGELAEAVGRGTMKQLHEALVTLLGHVEGGR